MTTTTRTAESGVQIRRISWKEFERITGRKRPANDDNKPTEKAA